MQNISKGHIHFNGDKLKEVLGLPKEVELLDAQVDREGVTLTVLSAGDVTIGEQQITHSANNHHENIRRINGFNLVKEAKSSQLQVPSLYVEGDFNLTSTVEKGLVTAEEARKSTVGKADYLLSLIAKLIEDATLEGNYDIEVIVQELMVEVVEKELNAKGYTVECKKDCGGSKLIQVKW